MGVVSSSEATICRVDEQQGDARKEDLGPSWCHLNGSIKQPPRVSPESCGLPSVISWTLIENNSHSTAKTVHIPYDGTSFCIKCGFLRQKWIGTS